MLLSLNLIKWHVFTAQFVTLPFVNNPRVHTGCTKWQWRSLLIYVYSGQQICNYDNPAFIRTSVLEMAEFEWPRQLHWAPLLSLHIREQVVYRCIHVAVTQWQTTRRTFRIPAQVYGGHTHSKYVVCDAPRERRTLIQCWINAGPASPTPDQQ